MIVDQNEDRHCPVCGNSQVTNIFKQTWALFDDHPLSVPLSDTVAPGNSYYGINTCDKCGMVFNSPIPDADAFKSYYSKWSRYAAGSDSLCGIVSPENILRFESTIDLVLPYLQSTELRILDIGCLDGGLLKQFRSRGFSNIAGIDPAPESSIHGKRDGIDIRVGTVSNIPFPDDSFDFILCVHMLEHVASFDKLHLERVLAPGGRLYIEVPNASAYSAESKDVFFDFSLEHINHFGIDSLRNTFSGLNFQLIDSGERIYPRGSAGEIQPSIYCIFEINSSYEINNILVDTFTSNAVKRFIAESTPLMQCQVDSFINIINRVGKLRLWGVGHAAFRLLGQTQAVNDRIVGITDSNPLYWGKKLVDLPVLSPDEFMKLDAPIYITSGIHADSIRSYLQNVLGFEGEIFSPAFDFVLTNEQ